MKNRLFVRPNLRLFLLGAALVCLVMQLINSGHSQSPKVWAPLPVQARGDAKAELRYLLEQAAQFPCARTYTQLCLYFERQGDYRKALFYLRQADAAAQNEDFED